MQIGRFRTLAVVVCVGLGLLVDGSRLLAHAQVAEGSIRGTVTDQSGAAVPGATVTVTAVET